MTDDQNNRPGILRKTVGLWFSGPIAAVNQLRESGRRFATLAAETGKREDGEPLEPETYEEALARRPDGASDTAQIRRTFVRFKNIATFFLIVAGATTLANLVLVLIASAFMAAGMTFLAYAFSFRFTLRIWQIDNQRLVDVKTYKQQNSSWLIDTIGFAKQQEA